MPGHLAATTVDNLRVPDGATCRLEGTFVKGTVKVEGDATLKAIGIGVIGNVQAENARKVVVRGRSRIGGSVQIVQGGAARFRRSRINGDILFDDQDGPLASRRNRVGGNVQAFQNTGGVTITNNRIDGNLQCKENAPPPDRRRQRGPGEQGGPVRIPLMVPSCRCAVPNRAEVGSSSRVGGWGNG